MSKNESFGVAMILVLVPGMASQTQGIQQLLAAEKRAAEKINEARKRKFQRMKQAKQEAQAEVEKYRQVGLVVIGYSPSSMGIRG